MSHPRRRKGIMLAYPFEERRLASWDPPFIVQPKLDGVRCRALPLTAEDGSREGWLLLSSEENVFFSVPHILKALNALPPEVTWELDGELYCHHMKFEEIVSITSRETNLHPNHDMIQYHVFDICDERAPQASRTLHLASLRRQLPTHGYIQVVPSFVAEHLEDVMNFMNSFVSQGYEGIIVRHIDVPYLRKRSTGMMKFKPSRYDEYLIVGYKEEISKDGLPKDALGSVTCEPFEGGERFEVGTGFTRAQRQEYWKFKEHLIGRTCKVAYQHLTKGRKVPRFPVMVEIL